MKVYKNKHCPKCGGNIFLEHDSSGWSEHCLQCGYDCDLADIIESLKPVAQSRPGNVTGQDARKPTTPKAVLELLEKRLVAQPQRE
jgi:ribosomal protein S27AE